MKSPLMVHGSEDPISNDGFSWTAKVLVGMHTETEDVVLEAVWIEDGSSVEVEASVVLESLAVVEAVSVVETAENVSVSEG